MTNLCNTSVRPHTERLYNGVVIYKVRIKFVTVNVHLYTNTTVTYTPPLRKIVLDLEVNTFNLCYVLTNKGEVIEKKTIKQTKN